MALTLPKRENYKPGPAGDTAFQNAMNYYNSQMAKQAPTPAPAAPAPAPTAPKPTPTPTAPAPTPTPALPTQSLATAGVAKDQIAQGQATLDPILQAAENAKKNATAENAFIQEDLTTEQKNLEKVYADQKVKKEQLTQQALEINDETAKVQEERATQEYQQNKFLNEQAQKQFDLDAARSERIQEEANLQNETQMRRAMAAQLGAAFGSEGMGKIMETRQRGEGIISDLRAQNAMGRAELSFKAMQIESNYTTSLKEISNERRTKSFELISSLDDELSSIDEKVLLSSSQKREAARKAITDYYEKLNGVDNTIAEATSKVVDKLFEQKKELEEEKINKESVDTNMSQALGYFANKYGQPIGVKEGEPPKPWVGQYNEALSKQFGFLVDEKGAAILGNDGKKITYTNFELQQNKSSLANYLGGKSTGYNNADLNLTIGANNYLKTAVKDGDYGGQCGTFIRTRFTTESGWEPCAPGDTACSVRSKKNLVDTRGFKVGQGVPKVGDVVVFTGPSYGVVGHYAMINEISEDQGYAVLTESNMDLKGTIRTTRRVPLDSPEIYGFFQAKLKQEVIDAQPNNFPMEAASSEGEIDMDQLDEIKKHQELFGDEATAKAIKSGKFNKKNDIDTVYTPEQRQAVSGLRDDFQQQIAVKDFQNIAAQYRDFDNIVNGKFGGAGDMALIYGFMKALDPSSVVREAEFDQAAQTGNIFQGAFAGINGKFKTGEKLPQSVREQFLKLVTARLKTRASAFDQVYNTFTERAQRQQLNPADVVINYKEGLSPLAETSAPTQNGQQNFTVQKDALKNFVEKARATGNTPESIITVLAKNPAYADKVKQSQAMNIPPDKILEFLTQ